MQYYYIRLTYLKISIRLFELLNNSVGVRDIVGIQEAAAAWYQHA